MLGQFISWREVSEFHNDLSDLLDDLASFAKKHPRVALPIFEIFIAGGLEKSEEIDHSGNDLGSFLDELACAWTRCNQDAGVKGDEYLQRLKHWIDADEIGFFSDLENTIIPSLKKDYRKALETELLGRLNTLSKEPSQSIGLRQGIASLKLLYAEAKNTKALIGFCERYGVDQKDCFNLASTFLGRKKYDHALEWAEKGLKLKEDRYYKEYELKELRRKILKNCGRRSDAVSDAWADFEKHPSIYSLESVLDSATKNEHSDIKDKALITFEKADLKEAAVALHKLKEFERLAIRLAGEKDKALQSIFYGNAIPIAEALSKKHPQQAARIYVAQAFEILDEKRAKAYHHAHDYLQNAKNLLEQCGDAPTWSALVTSIRSEHRRKSSFMPGFEKVAAGDGPPREPTFEERISKKLGRQIEV